MYPLSDFYQIFTFCGHLQVRSCVKIWADSLKGFQELSGLSLGCTLSQIFSVLWWQNYVSEANMFKGARMVQTSSISMPSLVGLGYRTPPGDEKVLRIFVCLSVMLLNDKVCE